jgi:multidrug transporter EmrE-like cation transporter
LGYLYLFGTIFFTVVGQITIKWRITKFGSLPSDQWDKVIFMIKLLMDPFIIASLFSAFISSFFWMAAATKFDISYAYPITSLSFVFIFILSIFLFHEPFSFQKLLGLALIILGVIVTSRSI